MLISSLKTCAKHTVKNKIIRCLINSFGARSCDIKNYRLSSTIETNVTRQAESIASNGELQEFMAVFPDIVKDLTEADPSPDISEACKRYAEVLRYNVPNGKKHRGLMHVSSYKMLESSQNLTYENIRLANILGWCIELFQSSILIEDDIMDVSETRRGQPCWYKIEKVGMQAVNDATMIAQGVYVLLKKYFSDQPCYLPITELFHDIGMKTTMGQSLDAMSMVNGKPQLDCFTMNRYLSITKYKTSYGAFYISILTAMYLARIYDSEKHRQVNNIFLEMGHFCQAENDVLDCFGNSAVTGKTGTDIREGKCTWLIATALQRATPIQKKILEQHYGKLEPESELVVSNLYKQLGLLNAFSDFKKNSLNFVLKHIQQLSNGLPHELFYKLVERVYKEKCY